MVADDVSGVIHRQARIYEHLFGYQTLIPHRQCRWQWRFTKCIAALVSVALTTDDGNYRFKPLLTGLTAHTSHILLTIFFNVRTIIL